MNQGNRADDNAIAWYEAHAASVAQRYEALSFPEVHNWLLYRLPERRDTTVLDIGSGTGRDAAWLAERGHEVVAVEPSEGLRREGQRRHPHPRIHWLNDRLPETACMPRSLSGGPWRRVMASSSPGLSRVISLRKARARDDGGTCIHTALRRIRSKAMPGRLTADRSLHDLQLPLVLIGH